MHFRTDHDTSHLEPCMKTFLKLFFKKQFSSLVQRRAVITVSIFCPVDKVRQLLSNDLSPLTVDIINTFLPIFVKRPSISVNRNTQQLPKDVSMSRLQTQQSVVSQYTQCFSTGFQQSLIVLNPHSNPFKKYNFPSVKTDFLEVFCKWLLFIWTSIVC